MNSAPYRRVAAHAKTWEQIGASPALFRMIKYGVLLTLNGSDETWRPPGVPVDSRRPRVRDTRIGSVDHSKGYAEEITEAEARRVGLVVSRFVVHGTKSRVVVDYTPQNEHLETRKLRMDTLADLAPQLLGIVVDT
jgi:hypothetical protein